jgi:hypothetical protein
MVTTTFTYTNNLLAGFYRKPLTSKTLTTSQIMAGRAPEPRNFEPQHPVVLAPPKNDPISLAELSTADGTITLRLHFSLHVSRARDVGSFD